AVVDVSQLHQAQAVQRRRQAAQREGLVRDLEPAGGGEGVAEAGHGAAAGQAQAGRQEAAARRGRRRGGLGGGRGGRRPGAEPEAGREEGAAGGGRRRGGLGGGGGGRRPDAKPEHAAEQAEEEVERYVEGQADEPGERRDRVVSHPQDIGGGGTGRVEQR